MNPKPVIPSVDDDRDTEPRTRLTTVKAKLEKR